MTDPLDDMCVGRDATLIQALEVIDRAASGMCCVVDDSRQLIAVLTDGDVRRALLSGASLDSKVGPHAITSPHVVREGGPRATVLDLMKSLRIAAVPEIDSTGRLVSVHTLSDIVGGSTLPNHAVIMAGGKGTRLGDLTKHRPKPLMMVAGRTIIERVIMGLVGGGIRYIHVSVNHMADQIVDLLGDGKSLGCRISYLREDPRLPLGTAGSLTLLPEDLTEPGSEPIIVLNADLMVEFDPRALIRSHIESGAEMTLATKTYQHSVPYGVVEFDATNRVVAIQEKPDLIVDVNAAVYCLDSGVARELPHGEPSTMPGLAELLLGSGRKVNAWRLESDWIDVGTPADLARAKGIA